MKNPARLQTLRNELPRQETRTVGELQREAERRFGYTTKAHSATNADADYTSDPANAVIACMVERRRRIRRVRNVLLAAGGGVSLMGSFWVTGSWIAASSYTGLFAGGLMFVAIGREVVRGVRLRRGTAQREALRRQERKLSGRLTVHQMPPAMHVDRSAVAARAETVASRSNQSV
jgi:hypothetical protein